MDSNESTRNWQQNEITRLIKAMQKIRTPYEIENNSKQQIKLKP